MATHQDIDRARKNGRASRQFAPLRPMNADRVVDLLVGASEPARNPFLRRAANALLEKMSKETWRVSAAPHEGGRDPDPDPSMHITVKIDNWGGSYHLGLHMNGQIARISGPDRVQSSWSPPGAPTPQR